MNSQHDIAISSAPRPQVLRDIKGVHCNVGNASQNGGALHLFAMPNNVTTTTSSKTVPDWFHIRHYSSVFFVMLRVKSV